MLVVERTVDVGNLALEEVGHRVPDLLCRGAELGAHPPGETF